MRNTLVLLSLLLLPFVVLGHPVPRSEFDRDINVEWRDDAVLVVYHLELDEFTMVATVGDPKNGFPIDFSKPFTPKKAQEAYLERMKVILADQMMATIDGKPLTFTATRAETVKSDDSKKFLFAFKAKHQVGPGVHRFELEDLSFPDKKGKLVMKLDLNRPLEVQKISTPPELRTTGEADLEKHVVSATAKLPGEVISPKVIPEPKTNPEPEMPTVAPTPTVEAEPRFWELFREVQRTEKLSVLLDHSVGFWFVLLIAALHGAIHSASPGHGKTMVAAYLVGEQGTYKHALLLGVIVTVTHTSTAFLVALLLKFALPDSAKDAVQGTLGVVGGVLIIGVGLWLLMKRVRGESDHFHGFGSHSHSHSHSHGGEHSHGMTPAQFAQFGWLRLLMLGISGGLVPCWGAILWVLYCITANRFGLALWTVLAFSAGLAVVLIVIGLGVVWVGRVGKASVYSESRSFAVVSKWLPIVGAITVVVIGLYLARQGLANLAF